VTRTRIQQLEKNFSRMFWIKALLNVKIINVILTLFYIHRGLTVSQIFYLSIVWAICNLLFEIPSSYMADRWGRKKTMLLGVMFAIVGWILLLFGHNFFVFVLAIIFSALYFAMFSGTDEALIYDTDKELNIEKTSLKRLSHFSSAQNIFKIASPLIAVFIAKDLTDAQFLIVIMIDVIATVCSMVLILGLVEAHHYIDVEKQEAGIILDAFHLIRKNPLLIRGIFGKTVGFIAGFIIWRYHQEYLVNHIGLSVLYLGIAWSVNHALIFLSERFIIPHLYHIRRHAIDISNYFFFIMSLVALYVVLYIKNPIILVVIIMITFFAERIRWSFYSQFLNEFSNSFNRATTISLSNFLKSILDIPLLFVAAVLVHYNIVYPFFFSALLTMITILFFRVSHKPYASS